MGCQTGSCNCQKLNQVIFRIFIHILSSYSIDPNQNFFLRLIIQEELGSSRQILEGVNSEVGEQAILDARGQLPLPFSLLETSQ